MNNASAIPSDPLDIIIVGAGISGINAAYRIQKELPSAKFVIIEARGSIGGTWDLFKYPGFRSDSDLYTFGFAWRPWVEQKIIADGESICQYIRESAAVYGIDRKIQFHHKLVSADWSSDQQMWSLHVDQEGTKKRFHSHYVILSTGYYDYDEALSSKVPGIEKFHGTTVHPQFWPKDLDYTDKKIVVVGSGSTAVTLIPKLAEKASHVTMLQRSPSYILPRPAIDPFSQSVRKYFPSWFAFPIIRLKFLVLSYVFLKFCSLYPIAARRQIKEITLKQLPQEVAHDPHFEPRYNPWEQRLCLCPDGDFFKAMRAGKASVVTDTISSVEESGIQLMSGQYLDADMIVTATGLKLKMAGGACISVDGAPITLGDKFLWNGVMLQDLPNLATVIGYTNASWTLGADATALLFCKLVKYMRSKGFASAVPRLNGASSIKSVPALNLTSTYVVRGMRALPKAGDKAPWLPRNSYITDLWTAKFGDITRELQFERVSV